MWLLHLRSHPLPHEPKIILRLKIHPDFRLRPEDTGESHRHVLRDRRPADSFRLRTSPDAWI